MDISVIASGSNGNCCVVEEKGTAVMVDAGKSFRETARRMEALGKDITGINAIILTHSHTDHVSGAGIISRKLGIPVYMTKATENERMISAAKSALFSTDRKFRIGGLEISPIKTSHNVESCGFMINRKFAIITDTGCATPEMKRALQKAKGCLLESNHDIDMLIRGRYPAYLKQWILSDFGHLSNTDAAMLLRENAGMLELAILGHLSGENNTPDKAMETFMALAGKKTDAVVASREKETGTFRI